MCLSACVNLDLITLYAVTQLVSLMTQYSNMCHPYSLVPTIGFASPVDSNFLVTNLRLTGLVIYLEEMLVMA
jgi:hypothetical protein